ncbi:MAG: hypothetical protein AB8B86_13300 [Pseudomonadales bacterium]
MKEHNFQRRASASSLVSEQPGFSWKVIAMASLAFGLRTATAIEADQSSADVGCDGFGPQTSHDMFSCPVTTVGDFH